MRIGKWAEAKIVFGDTTIGKRGIAKTPTGEAVYTKLYAGRVEVPASSDAGTGGTVRVLKATHGLDTILGALANERRAVATQMGASLINASTLLLSVAGYTAATTNFDVVIWGTAS